MSHDQNFKNLILDYPRQALSFFAPEETADAFADAEILPVRQEQLKERLGERFRELDVPLLVQWPEGRRAALLFVIEEETDPKRFSIHRLAHYCLDLAELFETDRVVPVVVFLRGSAPQYQLTLGGDRRRFLQFDYLACELATIPFDVHRESRNIVARINLPNMHFAPERKLETYAYATRGLLELEPDPEKRLKYIDFIDIYANLDDNERQRYELEYPDEADIMSSFSERFIEQGVERGERLGVRKGEATMLLSLLKLKFGDVPEPIRAKVNAADADTLLRWSERILTANDIGQVVGDGA
jgi:hypothetical protein